MTQLIPPVNTPTAALPLASGAPLFDEEGFLYDPLVWDEAMAQRIAAQDGLAPLTETHFKVLHYLRDRYLRLGGLPVMRLVCRANDLDREGVNRLFGGCRGAWRTAGLPNPGEEAKTYM